VNDFADISGLQKGLADLAEMSTDMAKACYARFNATDDKDARREAMADFETCARSTRLSILCGLRMSAARRDAIRAAADVALRPDVRLRTEADRERDRIYDRLRDRESDRETETDGHPMTALGRAQALEQALAGNPGLDPEGRYTARVIDIRSRLQGAEPEPPEPPEPAPAFEAPLPLNRAQRRSLERRKRRASG
jgi:hypothetical protein